MSATLINLIIQLVAGAAGGNAICTVLKTLTLGPMGNAIAGAVGGVGGGQLLQALLPVLANAASTGNFDIGAILGQVVGGGAGGAILTAVVGLLRNVLAGRNPA